VNDTEKAAVRRRVIDEPEFVNAKRFNNSLSELEKRYPDGCPDHVIASALVIPEEWVKPHRLQVARELRKLMGVGP
jgi:hypothetical protein